MHFIPPMRDTFAPVNNRLLGTTVGCVSGYLMDLYTQETWSWCMNIYRCHGSRESTWPQQNPMISVGCVKCCLWTKQEMEDHDIGFFCMLLLCEVLHSALYRARACLYVYLTLMS